MAKKVLLTDDDPTILKTYHRILEKAGFIVIDATDGEEAVSLAAQNKPDVILLDVVMAHKDGLSALKEIRSSDWGKRVPIILLTAKDVDEPRLKEINEWNPTYYLVKGNVSSADLISKINDLLSEQGAA